MQVYENPIQYWAEFIASGDLEKAERIREKYTDYEIMRAGLSKKKYG